jgi:hypothetical protein
MNEAGTPTLKSWMTGEVCNVAAGLQRAARGSKGGPRAARVAAMPEKAEETVKVVVRVRPLSRKEIQDGHDAATVADEATGRITCNNPKADASDPPKAFTFDAVFDPNITQRKLYDICSAPVVDAVLAGFNGTIFAYGQTGAGKTFTMEGVPDPPELRGIIPNAFQQIFDRVALAQEGQQFLVRASYLEIYNEEIRDLLSKDPKNKLELKENVDSGVYVKDLTSFIVKSSHEIDQVMQAGKKNRSVAARESTGEPGRPDQTSTFSSSVTSTSIRLIFGRIDCSHRVLEAQPKRLFKPFEYAHIEVGWKI